MSNPFDHTKMEREIVVYRFDPKANVKVMVMCDILGQDIANRFVRKKMDELSETQLNNGICYRSMVIPKYIRSFWAVERCCHGIREYLLDDWCTDELDADWVASECNAQECEEEPDGGSSYSYRAVMVSMDDDEILDHFFDYDEDAYHEVLGCLPMTYDRILNPHRDAPQPIPLPI